MTETDQAWLKLRGNGTRARATTLSIKRTTKTERRLLRADVADDFPDIGRPKTRGDCADGPRPCPWVACRYHLYVDVRPNGSLRLPFPEQEPWDLPETCALDVAERGGLTLEQAGYRTNLTRERVRQLELLLFAKLRGLGLEELFPAQGRYAAAPDHMWDDTLPGRQSGGVEDEDEKTEVAEPEEAPPPKKEEEPMGEMQKLAKELDELNEEVDDVLRRRNAVAEKLRGMLDGAGASPLLKPSTPEPAVPASTPVKPKRRIVLGVADGVRKLLKEYDHQTGEDLAGKLKVSRATIARAVIELREAGHKVKALRGKGYWIDD